MPSISFAVAARNSEKLIGSALDSIPTALAGLGVRYEVLLADGSSTDRTVEVALSRAGVRLVSTSDGGIYDGMNRAIAAATGDFILILNSDDELLPEGMSAAIAALASDTTSGMASASALYGRAVKDAAILSHDRTLTLEGACFGIPVINARLFRRPWLERIGPFRTEIGLAADRELMIRIAERSEHGHAIAAPLYFYRQHQGSQTLSDDRPGRLRIYQAEAKVGSYCREAYESHRVRTLARAAQAVAQMKWRTTTGHAGLSSELGATSLADLARGIWLWRRWRGRTSGA